MSIPLLIIGTAPTGPEGQIYSPLDLDSLIADYAPYRYTSYSYTAATTGFILPEPAWGQDISALHWVFGKLKPLSLFNLAVSGTSVTLGSPGASGSLLLRYSPVPTENDLVVAAKAVVKEGGVLPSVFRVPGVKAQLNLGALVLEALEGGIRLNAQTVTFVNSGGYSLQFLDSLDSQQRSFSYSSSSIPTIVSLINQDADKGRIPFRAYSIPQNAVSSSGTYNFIGGAPGQLDGSSIDLLAQSLDLEGVETILVAGGISGDLVSRLFSAWVAEDSTLLFTGTPAASSIVEPNALVSILLSEASSLKDHRVFRIPGSVLLPGEFPGQFLNHSLASSFAALWNKSFRSPTHQATTYSQIYPFWTSDQLHSLQSTCCPYTRFVQTNIAPWSSNPTDGHDPTYSRLRQEISRRLSNSLLHLIGHGGELPAGLQTICENALEDLPGVREKQIELNLKQDTLNISIGIIRYGELRTLTFNFTTHR